MESFKRTLHLPVNKLSTRFFDFIVKKGNFQYIVDNVMLSNYYTLRYIASTLDSIIRGWPISEIYSQEKDELAVAFRNDERHLLLCCRSEGATLYLRDRMARAKRNTVDLLPGAVGSAVTGVRILSNDRVVAVELETGLQLTALLFGARSNVLLLDSRGTVLDAFKNPKKLLGTVVAFSGRDVVHDIPAFRAAAATAGSATASSVLRKSFPVLGATLVQEVLLRAGISPSIPASRLEPSSLDALSAALGSVLSDLGRPLARVYTGADSIPALFSIIPLRQGAALDERRFDNAGDAVRFFLAGRAAAVVTEEGKGVLVSSLRQRIEKARRTRQAIDEDARAAERADEYGRHADLLMSNLQAFPKGSRSVTLASTEGTVTIPLEPSLSPMQNAQRYYEKAKRSRATAHETAGRAAEIDGKIARGERLLASAELCATRDDVRRFMAGNAEGLDEFGIGQRSREREELPFRIFTVEGGFEVWAGKNSANNDLLTLRYAKPDDLWFHARGAGGSHVVLKVGTGKGEPGKKAREQAAGIAAYYSKMKNASMVPVAMTEKRYVRKPKGSQAGTVVIEREKVIFAAPALPSPAKNVSP